MAYELKPGKGRTFIFYKGEQLGFIASNVAKTEWFALEGPDDNLQVVTGFHTNLEAAFRAFKKYRRTGKKEPARK